MPFYCWCCFVASACLHLTIADFFTCWSGWLAGRHVHHTHAMYTTGLQCIFIKWYITDVTGHPQSTFAQQIILWTYTTYTQKITFFFIIILFIYLFFMGKYFFIGKINRRNRGILINMLPTHNKILLTILNLYV